MCLLDGVATQGDHKLLGILLENLLGNAWKFTSKRELARIEFGQQGQGGRSTYFVQDDGAGFDKARRETLWCFSTASFPRRVRRNGDRTLRRETHRAST